VQHGSLKKLMKIKSVQTLITLSREIAKMHEDMVWIAINEAYYYALQKMNLLHLIEIGISSILEKLVISNKEEIMPA